MKKIILLFAAFFMLAASNAYSQKGIFGTRPSLSVGAELGLPVADLSTFHNIGLGGSLKLGMPLFDGADVTFSAGYISFAGKTISGSKVPAINVIPIKAGLRFKLANSVYGEPQLGYSSLKASGASDGIGAFTYAINVGFLLTKNFDLAARYENASKNNSNFSHVGARLAYNFSL